MGETAPKEAVGCILDAGQEAKKEILDEEYAARTRYRLLPGVW
jgi:hypothetical protein